jgi:hypothetical protein
MGSGDGFLAALNGGGVGSRGVGGAGFYAAVLGGGVGGSLLLMWCIVGCVLFACRGKFQTGPERTRSLLYGMCFM